jgi:hypothetical protein
MGEKRLTLKHYYLLAIKCEKYADVGNGKDLFLPEKKDFFSTPGSRGRYTHYPYSGCLLTSRTLTYQREYVLPSGNHFPLSG